MHAGLLQANGAGRVPKLLRLVERLDRFVVFLSRAERSPEVERGKCGFGVPKMLGSLLHVAEEVVGDAKLQVNLLWIALTGFEPLDERLGHVAERAELGSALSETGAELLNGSARRNLRARPTGP